jgi:ATP-dependent Clp protease adaptor protein ClpS
MPPLTPTSRRAATAASTAFRERSPGTAEAQKLMEPSPLRPHTTMAIEKVKVAARAAQPRVISTAVGRKDGVTVPKERLRRTRMVVNSGVPVTSSSPQVSPSGATVLDRAPYPNYRVVVLNDDVNTFQHVVDCLVKYIPAMTPDRAWSLAHRIDGEGSAVVWVGPQEQAELYHMQLGGEGLTMAPLERN